MRDLYANPKFSIRLNYEDELKWNQLVARDHGAGFPPDAPPQFWATVVDQETGKQWKVAPTSCGAGCRCAAEMVEVS